MAAVRTVYGPQLLVPNSSPEQPTLLCLKRTSTFRSPSPLLLRPYRTRLHSVARTPVVASVRVLGSSLKVRRAAVCANVCLDLDCRLSSFCVLAFVIGKLE